MPTSDLQLQECANALCSSRAATTVAKLPESKRSKGLLGVYQLWDTGHGHCRQRTLEFPKVVYVLHAFQKKSKNGIATPKSDIDLIKSRLRAARADYEDRGKSLR